MIIQLLLFPFADISSGNILLLIRNNCDLNAAWIKGDVSVHELNFYDDNYPDELVARIESSNVIIAADGAFIQLFNSNFNSFKSKLQIWKKIR